MVLPFDIFSERPRRGNPKPCARAHRSSPGSEVYGNCGGEAMARQGALTEEQPWISEPGPLVQAAREAEVPGEAELFPQLAGGRVAAGESGARPVQKLTIRFLNSGSRSPAGDLEVTLR